MSLAQQGLLHDPGKGTRHDSGGLVASGLAQGSGLKGVFDL